MEKKQTNHPQKIAIIGSGAVGSYYGARLAEAGHDVRFLMRRDYQAVKENGLKITSPLGDITLTNPTIALNSKDIGPVNWVICSLKATAIDEAYKLVEPCVSAGTRILALMNGLGNEERFAEWFGPKRISGGMAFTAINRGEPGYVHHLAFGNVTIGHFQNDPEELGTALALFEGSKVKVNATACLRCARWEKMCWNIPFSGLCVAAGGITTDIIAGDARLRNSALTLMEEVIMAANADLAAHSETARLDHDETVKYMFHLTDNLGPYRPSMLLDFREQKMMEVEALFAEPLRRAHSHGVDAPQIDLLTSILLSLNVRR